MDSGEDLQNVSLPGAGETERTIFENLAIVGSSSLPISEDKDDDTIDETTVIDVIKVDKVIEVEEKIIDKEQEDIQIKPEVKVQSEKDVITEEEVSIIKEYDKNEDQYPNEEVIEVKNLIEVAQGPLIDISLLEDEDDNSISDQISENSVIHLDEKVISNDNKNNINLNSCSNSICSSNNIIQNINSSDNTPVCNEQNNNNNNDQSSDVDVGGNSLHNEKSENINEVVNTLDQNKIESVCVELINDRNIIVEKLVNKENNELIDSGIVNEQEESDTNKHDNKPPIPIQTYRWEEIRRAKQQGGYPWTHLYKSPLGPDDEPEIILRFNISPQNRRKVQQQLIDATDIPKSPKKVRIQKEVSFQEADEIPELDNNLENISPVVQEENCAKQETVTTLTASPKSILKRSHPKKIDLTAASNSQPRSDEEDSPKKSKCCPYPFVEKLKTMADKQLHKVSARKLVKKNPLSDITLEEEQKVLRLKESPRANHRGIISYVEKQDSDEILELIDYEESPGEARKHRLHTSPDQENSTLTPDEIIELPAAHMEVETDTDTTDFAKPVEEEIIVAESKSGVKADPPPKAPRKKKDHVYEDIETPQGQNNNFIAEIGSNEEIRISLQAQDMQVLDEIHGKQKYLDETISDDHDEVEAPKISLLAPISSIDSTSSDEDRRVLLPTLSEESETSTSDVTIVSMKLNPNQEMNANKKMEEKLLLTDDAIQEKSEIELAEQKTTNNEKKVTFMNAELSDDNEEQVCEIRKEDVPAGPEVSIPIDSRWSKMSDHEYEPIGDPIVESVKLTTTPSPTFFVSAPSNDDDEIADMDMEGAVGGVVDDPKEPNGTKRPASEASSITSHERKLLRVPAEDECEDDELSVDEIQKQIEDKYFNASPTATDSINPDEINTTEGDTSAIDDMPSEAEVKKKGIFSNTQQRGKIMQAKLRTQAGKIKTRFGGMKKAKSESPKAKVQRKRFRPIEFSKFKRPEMPKFSKPEFKRPEFTKFSKPEFKRPEFTKFNKPEFKRPEFTKFSKPEFKRPEFTKFSKPEFKRPEFTKFSKPEFKRPEFTKFSKPEFKRPEFTKFKKPHFPEFQMFKRSDSKTTDDSEIPTSSDSRRLSKPEVSRFRIPEKFSSLRLRRSKSLKEKPVSTSSTSPVSTEDEVPVTSTPTNKKFFDFHFGTYPRILQKKKKHKNIAVDDIEVLHTPTPTTFEFATVPRTKKSGLSEQISNIKNSDDDSGRYKQYDYDIEQERERERESSVERRMRMTFERSSIEMEDEALGILHTDEQIQMAEFDKENREIHNISKIKKDDNKYKQPMERQESDPISDDVKQMEWSSHLNRTDSDLRSDELDLPQGYDDELEHLNGDLSPSRSNIETRSSGSSSLRHKQGVIEEIDDDEFFLRKKGISEDNIQIGEYISSAIREGLGTPRNALANVGNYGNYYDDEDDDDIDGKNGRYKMEFSGYDVPKRYSRKSEHDEYEDDKDDSKNNDNYKEKSLPNDYFETFPPNRPLRKPRKQSENEDQDGSANFQPYFYQNSRMEGIEQPNILVTNNEDNERDFETMNFYENHIEEEFVRPATPPKAPKRRRKVKRDLPAFNQRNTELSKEMPIISDSTIPNGDTDNIIVYRTEHEYIVPVAPSEVVAPPSPLPRRSRSRSQTSNNHLTDEKQTKAEIVQTPVDHKPANNFNDLRDADGYAIVKKEPPPRPPAPLRRKRSTRSLGDKQFATMPHIRRGITPPVRPRRTYSTIGPSRPPRRKSSSSLQNIRSYARDTTHSSPDVTQYEELTGDSELQNESHRDLHSGDVINKMKYRPLPPPPRPPRELKKHKKPDEDDDDDNNKQDKDDGAEFTVETEVVKHVVDDEVAPKIEEVEVSTQTDPLPDDFCCEEFEITDDMPTISPSISPSKSKTLEDILREQEADMEIVEQITAEQSLARGLQRFREANQRSYSERSKTSDHQRRSTSRPATPAAFIIERKVSTPIPMSMNNFEAMLTEASLIVQPVDVDVDINNNENANEEEELEKTSNLSTFVEKSETDKLSLDEPLTEEEQQIILDALSRFDQEQKELNTYEDDIKVDNIERTEDVPDNMDESTVDNFTKINSEQLESQPVAPPRKKSLGETLATTVVDSPVNEVNEEQSVPAKLETNVNENSLSNRIQISELEVDRLSVNELQAGRIMVSQLEGVAINAQELDCQSGNLIVRNIELPAGFIEELIDRIRSSEHTHMQSEEKETTEKNDAPKNGNSTETKVSNEDAPERPPPPQQYTNSEYFPYSIPPPSFFQLRNYSEEDLPNPPVARRRRHHRRRESTSEEEHQQRDQRNRRHGTRSPEPTVTELGSQFAHACGSSLLQSGNQLMNMLKAASKDENKKDLHIAVVILLIIITGILLLGNSDKSIHHHHWEYFNPPGNSGSQ